MPSDFRSPSIKSMDRHTQACAVFPKAVVTLVLALLHVYSAGTPHRTAHTPSHSSLSMVNKTVALPCDKYFICPSAHPLVTHAKLAEFFTSTVHNPLLLFVE